MKKTKWLYDRHLAIYTKTKANGIKMTVFFYTNISSTEGGVGLAQKEIIVTCKFDSRLKIDSNIDFI